MLSVRFHLFICLLLSIPMVFYGQRSDLTLNTVAIDPGHGGKDKGTSMDELSEKDIVLDVAKKLSVNINQLHPDVKVILTRESDVFIPLDKRAEIANKNKADLFISLHVNFYKEPQVYGSESYILGTHRSEDNLKVAQLENSVILLEDDYTTRYEGFDPNSAESYIMFELLQNEFLEQSRSFADQVQQSISINAKRRSRGVKQAGFLVLRETVMPSILVEIGYISNNTERAFLKSETGRSEIALALAKAFSNYKIKYDAKSSVDIPQKQIIAPDTLKQQIQANDIYNVGKWYAVQIAASKKQLNKKQLSPIGQEYFMEIKEDGWFKYYCGFTKNYDEVLKKQHELNKSFKGAFLVVVNDGNKEKFYQF